MTVDWDDLERWGKPGTNVTVGTTTNDAHTTSEDDAERRRG